MALLRLLTAGKSLVGLKDPEARYRMTDPRSMPKFGSKKNPFSRNGKSGTVENPAAAITQVQPEVPRRAGLCETQRGDKTSGLVTSGPLRKNSTLRLPEARPSSAPQAKTKVAGQRQAARAGSQLSSWIKMLKPLLSFRALKKSIPARVELRPVQGELSLDKVKVMRNDLSDTDFVIVRKRAQAPVEPGFAFAEKPENRSSTPVESALVNS